MKYIDAEKLKAEIERLQQEVRNKWKENTRSSVDDGFLTACSRFLNIITSLQQEQSDVDLFECPKIPIKDAVEVTSRMKYIDEELRPVAEFIMPYASWNLHKNEWNQPTIEVPLFRVLDALAQKGKPYYCGG